MPDTDAAEKCLDTIKEVLEACVISGHAGVGTLERLMRLCDDGKAALHRRVKREQNA